MSVFSMLDYYFCFFFLRHIHHFPTCLFRSFRTAEISPKDAVMYVGIDVTHPTANSGIDISIACMVASFDLAATRYSSCRSVFFSVFSSKNTSSRRTAFFILDFYIYSRYTNEIFAQMKGKETVECFEKQFIRLMTKFHEVCRRSSNFKPICCTRSE